MVQKRKVFRNPVVQSPLLRKGGVHQKSRSAERRNQRHAVEAELEGWREELQWLEDGSLPEGTDGSDSPPLTFPPVINPALPATLSLPCH